MESGILFKKGYLVPMLRRQERSIKMQLMSNTRPSAETTKNSHDVHYGPVVVLSVGHGHLRTTSTGKGRCQVRNHGNRLLHQIDRSQATDEHGSGASPSKRAGGKGQQELHESEAVISDEMGIHTYQTLTIREGYNEEEMRLNLDLLKERRETAAIREARYKTKTEQY
ncbi:hypothetical protein Tco_0403700 [Tanacetum coccineum]